MTKTNLQWLTTIDGKPNEDWASYLQTSNYDPNTGERITRDKTNSNATSAGRGVSTEIENDNEPPNADNEAEEEIAYEGDDQYEIDDSCAADDGVPLQRATQMNAILTLENTIRELRDDKAHLQKLNNHLMEQSTHILKAYDNKTASPQLQEKLETMVAAKTNLERVMDDDNFKQMVSDAAKQAVETAPQASAHASTARSTSRTSRHVTPYRRTEGPRISPTASIASSLEGYVARPAKRKYLPEEPGAFEKAFQARKAQNSAKRQKSEEERTLFAYNEDELEDELEDVPDMMSELEEIFGKH
ncbi:hypothetical protein M426DRAFT_26789 [Hypoxylon sp. CI-4A]|nr:hypothetical protein M426DRAFT_26789 [Hypoxylon sp. CI-4A]